MNRGAASGQNQEPILAPSPAPEGLDQARRRALDQDGFTIIPDMAEAAWLEAARLRYEELVVIEGADLFQQSSYRSGYHREVGTRRLADLCNKGAVWDRVWQDPRLLAAVASVLQGPFKLSSLSGRDAQQGHGGQGLHADWGRREPSEPFQVVNCIWALDGLDDGNGGPRLVPGSHRWAGSPAEAMGDPSQPHPSEIIPTVLAGGVLVMNAHIWHGGTTNRDGRPRRSLHAYYCARQTPQQLDQREHLRVQTALRLSTQARWLLDAL